MNVLGLDLSLTSTGVAYPDGRVDRLSPRLDGMDRLSWFAAWLDATLLDVCPDIVAVEGYAMGSSRQSHSYAIGELGGTIRLALHVRDQPYADIPPATLKKFATGKGNASKDEMLVAAVRRLGYEGASNDEADALWLRVATLDAYGLPEIEMPKAQRDVLGKVDWPVLDDALGGVA